VQALSSYVLIATDVLLCTSPPSQQNLLELVLPAILPYMTTHHHNLQSFAQVQQSTVKPCLLTFWGLMIPKKGCRKKRKKAIYTVPSYQWAVAMQSILCTVNPQGGGVPKIRGLGQGDNATLGWVARCLFIEF
jgi:hypothetical protein